MRLASAVTICFSLTVSTLELSDKIFFFFSLITLRSEKAQASFRSKQIESCRPLDVLTLMLSKHIILIGGSPYLR